MFKWRTEKINLPRASENSRNERSKEPYLQQGQNLTHYYRLEIENLDLKIQDRRLNTFEKKI
jgi:hypothetical protein